MTVCNQGTAGGSASVRLGLSDVSAPESQELQLEYLGLGWLEEGQCSTEHVEVQVEPPHDGAWLLRAVADPEDFEPELIETNNTLEGNVMGLGYGPDYIVQAVSGPASVQVGGLMTVSVRTCNQGTTDGSTDVQRVLTDGSQAQPVFSFSSGPLPAGQCSTRRVEVQIGAQHEGSWLLGAVIDPDNSEPELIESNNALEGNAVGIGFAADFVIQAVSSPVSMWPGMVVPVSVTVCNQGTDGASTDVRLVVSEDADIRFSSGGPSGGQDRPVASFASGFLEAGQCATQQVQVQVPGLAEGPWYLGAVVNPDDPSWELIATNNTRASGDISFQ